MEVTVRCGVIRQVREASQVGDVRRLASRLARELGFDATREGEAAIVASELASNLVKHAQQGEMVLQSDMADQALHLWSLDRGPGMRNVGECFRDGYSTAGSAGTGLGAVRRLSQCCELYSDGEGTVVYVQMGGAGDKAAAVTVAALTIPHPHETVCGDAWAARTMPGGAQIMVTDGLGHGPHAATAAQTAQTVWETDAQERSPLETLQTAHVALRATRGAAMALAWIDIERGQVRYGAVGNISATIASPSLKTRSLVSNNGTVGLEMRRLQEYQYPLKGDDVLIMHSDGIATHWRLDRYPGLLTRHPALIAGVLFRDFRRGRDDATVLVLRRSNNA